MGFFEKLALSGTQQNNTQQPNTLASQVDAEQLTSSIKSYEDLLKKGYVEKAIGQEDTAQQEPLLGMMSVNPDYREKNNYTKSMHRVQEVLKRFGNNIIVNAIINTRSDQVSLYCQPTRYSKKGMGFEVRLKDVTAEATDTEKEEMKEIEDFLVNTSKKVDTERDSFYDFCKKIIRDTLLYDQVNFEKNIDKNTGELLSFLAVDPTTIFYKTKDSKIVRNKEKLPKFVQVIDDKVVNEYTAKEMAMGVRRPRTDIASSGYGYSELEVALKQIIAHENTEAFNDRFFSHGGTTRGVLLIKQEQQSTTYALENFKREWKSSLSGINGSWQIPVINAEDVKFINMTPTANDMQFEKWLNYLINVICSVYGIDPSEINFPNRGGATGSKSNSLNEGSSSEKHRDSKTKGLEPLLKFIENMINKYIIPEFSDKYIFEFSGGDNKTELEKLAILEKELELFKVPDEARIEQGYEGTVPGGDTILNGVSVQRQIQLMQEKEFAYKQERDKKEDAKEQEQQEQQDPDVNEQEQPEEEQSNSDVKGQMKDHSNDRDNASGNIKMPKQ